MKSIKTIFRTTVLALTSLGGMMTLNGCQDNFDIPPVTIPRATMTANTTIAELKAALWSDDVNYAVLVGKKSSGEDYIVKGRVISSDAAGNVYKSLVIQDETGALPMSINMTSMYNTYRVGQEIVIDVTGIYCGKYAGYEQLGGYGEYNGTPQTSFMAQETFTSHAELNLLPSPEMTIVAPGANKPSDGIYCLVAEIGSLPQTAEGQREWQGQLVEFRNVTFEGGGSQTYAAESDWASGTTSRTIKDASGNSLTIRNSGYATFCKDVMPSGNGTVRGILSYFNGAYQLLIRSTADVIFDSKGNQDDPYSIEEAIELQGTGAAGWTKGYIVGSVKAGVSTIVSSEQIIWSKDAEMDNTLVIAPSKDCKDISKCLVVELPNGSALRTYGNLLDNPAVYQATINIYGVFDKYLGTYGITGNTGSTGEFIIDGVTPNPNPNVEAVASLYCDFEGYGADISTLCSQKGWAIAKTSGDKDWWLREFSSNTYATATAYKGSNGPWKEWLISPAIDIDKSPKKTLEFITQAAYQAANCGLNVYVLTSQDPSTATKTLLNASMPNIPASGYSDWVNSGTIDLSSFSGVIYIGWEYYADSATTSSTYCIDNVNIGGAETGGGGGGGGNEPNEEGDGTEASPYNVKYVMDTTKDETGVWVEGYVVGWVSGMTWATGATFNGTVGSDYTNTNIILGPASGASVSNSIPVQLPNSGDIRTVLGLGNNPSIYMKHVKMKADITKYFGVRALKNMSEYKVLD